ncbi:hypothetical protein [Shinella sp.]|uniref:hypothetical protein n=1 Tax=Shinella sp. TaxID=1870904 RepID=UPI00258C1819|nr:hypothetical protein [Shinella sp.]MCO5136267.1 hypothetical protein [Shinella sp.]
MALSLAFLSDLRHRHARHRALRRLPEGTSAQGRFFSFILMFMGAMLGLVASDSFPDALRVLGADLDHLLPADRLRPCAEASRRAALQALVVTGGGLFTPGRPAALWNVTDVTQLSLLMSFGAEVRASPFYLPLLFLILGGAFASRRSSRSISGCRTPWAPTPVSAYLHSATMVKAGVYLLFGSTPSWATRSPGETCRPSAG